MWSFARWMLQYSLKNSREYPKTSGAIPRGLRPLGIAPSVFGYSLSFFREYFAIRLAKLHILLQYKANRNYGQQAVTTEGPCKNI